MPDQPTSKLTSLGLARTAKLKVEAGAALMCVYPSAKEWVCVPPNRVWLGCCAAVFAKRTRTVFLRCSQSVAITHILCINSPGLVWPTSMKKKTYHESLLGTFPALENRERLCFSHLNVCVCAGFCLNALQYSCISKSSISWSPRHMKWRAGFLFLFLFQASLPLWRPPGHRLRHRGQWRFSQLVQTQQQMHLVHHCESLKVAVTFQSGTRG